MSDPMKYAVDAPERPCLPVEGSDALFPVRRVYCVGRNYAAHAREMGADDKEPPFFFMKPADAVVVPDSRVTYPPMTEDLHHEIELVCALKSGGTEIPAGAALSHVWGYGVGLDLTRRDLQAQAKDMRRPWDPGKVFDGAAPVSALRSAEDIDHPDSGRIWLDVDGKNRQSGDLSDMIWQLPDIIAHLSGLFRLAAGDLIFTGTPEGVGPVVAGNVLTGGVDGVGEISVEVV